MAPVALTDEDDLHGKKVAGDLEEEEDAKTTRAVDILPR